MCPYALQSNADLLTPRWWPYRVLQPRRKAVPAVHPGAKKLKIDAHHHFWRYSAAQYGWIEDAISVLRHDFLPSDLDNGIRKAGIDGVVSVRARQTLARTRWLLTMDAQRDFIKGVVGWVLLTHPSVCQQLELLRG